MLTYWNTMLTQFKEHLQALGCSKATIQKYLHDVGVMEENEKGIKTGPVFVTRTGKPMDRSNIWRMIQKLAKTAEVASTKAFPHSFRHFLPGHTTANFTILCDFRTFSDTAALILLESTLLTAVQSSENSSVNWDL